MTGSARYNSTIAIVARWRQTGLQVRLVWEFPKQIAYYEGGIKEPEKINVKSEELDPKVETHKHFKLPFCLRRRGQR
jgi:hypothetical protein